MRAAFRNVAKAAGNVAITRCPARTPLIGAFVQVGSVNSADPPSTARTVAAGLAARTG